MGVTTTNTKGHESAQAEGEGEVNLDAGVAGVGGSPEIIATRTTCAVIGLIFHC